MSRTTEAGRGGVGVREGSDGEGAIPGADSGRDGSVGGVNGDGVGGAAEVFVVGDHLGEVEAFGEGGSHGGADETRGVTDDEAHLFGGDIFGSNDQVCFVLTGRVIEDNEDLAIA